MRKRTRNLAHINRVKPTGNLGLIFTVRASDHGASMP
jgi:hypothetical protein